MNADDLSRQQARIAIVLFAHEGLATAFATLVRHVWAEPSVPVIAIDIAPEMSPQDGAAAAAARIADAGDIDQLLILVDLFGATPFNAAQILRSRWGACARLAAGLIAPIVLAAVQCASRMGMAELVRACAARGRRGVRVLRPLGRA